MWPLGRMWPSQLYLNSLLGCMFDCGRTTNFFQTHLTSILAPLPPPQKIQLRTIKTFAATMRIEIS